MGSLSRCVTVGRALRALTSSCSSTTRNTHAAHSVEDWVSGDGLSVSPREDKRRPALPPFVKSIFCGQYERSLLAYPEVLDKEEWQRLLERAGQAEQVLRQEDQDQLEGLKGLRLLGAPALVFHGGLQANYTECLRFLESFSSHLPLAEKVMDQWVGIHTLMRGFPSSSLDNLMPDLTSYGCKVKLLIKEQLPESCEIADISCKALRTVSGEWLISGRKLRESLYPEDSADHPTCLVVLCAVKHQPMQTFLVYPGADGVRIDKDGNYSFDKTPGTLLGEHYEEEKTPESKIANILQDSISGQRLFLSALCMGLMKEAINTAVEFGRSRFMGGVAVQESQTFVSRLGTARGLLYQLEAALYFAAGIADGYEDPDWDLEAMLCVRFALGAVSSSIHQLSAVCYQQSPTLQTLARSAQHLTMRCGQLPDIIGVAAGLNGLKYAAFSIADEVKKVRNPLYYPSFILKKLWQDRSITADEPGLTYKLFEHLHPSLTDTSEALEVSAIRLHAQTKDILAKHGQEIIQQHNDVCRIADIAEQVFIMSATIARANRSYCIGVEGSEKELSQAVHACQLGEAAVRNLSEQLKQGEYLNGDTARNRLIMAQSPLTKTF